MHQNGAAEREALLDRVVAHVLEKMPQKDGPLVERFVRQYYRSASISDLKERNLVDLHGAVLSHWRFLENRKSNSSKVHVYNPNFEQHSWQSTHTVVEIIQDEMPFLMESLRMELHRRGLTIHLMMYLGGLYIERDSAGRLEAFFDQAQKGREILPEAAVFIEIDRQQGADLHSIQQALEEVLAEVRAAVSDWEPMRHKMAEVIDSLRSGQMHHLVENSSVLPYLEWALDHNFTFLSYSQQRLLGEGEHLALETIPGSHLGISALDQSIRTRSLSDLPLAAREQALSTQLLLLGKTSTLSRVHRPVHTDFISIKCIDPLSGQIQGEHRFVGLYTAAAYNRSPVDIPYLREKVQALINRSGLSPESHDGRMLLHIIETLPRDDLFQAPIEELFDIAMGIFHLQERQKIKLFIRKDIFARFFSCLVFIPRDKFTSELRQKMQDIIEKSLCGKETSFSTRFSESVLARVHFMVRIDPTQEIAVDIQAIENALVEVSRTWYDRLCVSLIEAVGEAEGNRLYRRYLDAFPIAYCDEFIARNAVVDIMHLETLNADSPLAMSFYQLLEEQHVHFKLFQQDRAMPLSDMMPLLESMGLRVLGEQAYVVSRKEGDTLWINDFSVSYMGRDVLDLEKVKDIFQDAFYHVWNKSAENDGFNALVLQAGLSWREVVVLRAYAKYLWQIGFAFSQSYIEKTLSHNVPIVQKLIALFLTRIEPQGALKSIQEKEKILKKELESLLAEVKVLDEDRILRRYIELITATIRCNYHQKDPQGLEKEYISFKFDPSLISDLPLPKPLFEIYVYSPSVEGVHLRAAPVARGGIRWSERREDYRTEILGLVKAQQVKNAVIVPMGAKGGFVVKKDLSSCSRDAWLAEGIRCYQIFIQGLLDLTDNIVQTKIQKPDSVRCYDADDPYLVVAADKGTATFSDIANALSQKSNFWLGDAFASGGSAGYDHKKMGITARGAWESVKRHFLEMGIDIQKQDCRVLGIGDMSGDVFGNGMLLSEHIALVAAFDYRHIFLDPQPDVLSSFAERKRLFSLPRSSWADYNPDLLSEGGGIFERSLKSIPLSPAVRTMLQTDQESMDPDTLIHALLQMEVDLLWNGGIGTYIKASHESHLSVGDRNNNAIRVNADQVKARVIGEGGNLGMTQLGRVQYALLGGRLNTDAIDNSAGVDCSDHEVNIKILLNQQMQDGNITLKARNQLLLEMTEDVASLVIADNRAQTEVLSITVAQAAENADMHRRLMMELENSGKLNPALEFLPTKEELMTRKSQQQGLTRPELAVLLAYVKNGLKETLRGTPLLKEPYVQKYLKMAFPERLYQEYPQAMTQHYLCEDIIATQLANCTVNEMGLNFVQRVQDETGASVAHILRCYVIAREVFSIPQLRDKIAALKHVVSPETQIMMYQEVNRLARRATRWFVRHPYLDLSIEKVIESFYVGIQDIAGSIHTALKGIMKQSMEHVVAQLLAAKVPSDLAHRIAIMSPMFSALDIVEASIKHHLSIDQMMYTYFAVGARLKLGWYRESIKKKPVHDHWDALARSVLRDDLDRQQRILAIIVLHKTAQAASLDARIDQWMESNAHHLKRWHQITAELKATPHLEFMMFAVAFRELFDLVQVNAHQENV